MEQLNIESETDESTARKGKKELKRGMIGWLCTNRRNVVIGIISVTILFQIHKTSSNLQLAASYEVLTKIQTNYADIKGIDDLEKRSRLIKDRCYVSLLHVHTHVLKMY